MTEKDQQLLAAVKNDDIELIERLLNSNECDVNVVDEHGCQAITHILSTESAQLLVKHGANIDAEDLNGESLLRRAAHFSQNTFLKQMLLLGADIEFRSRKGYTPLHRASYNNRDDSVRTLLAFGADPNALNFEGETPLDLIDSYHAYGMTIPMLFAAGAEPRSEPHRRKEHWGEKIAEARREIAVERFQLIRKRMLEICIAMQGLELPALLTVAVIDEAIALAPLVELHFKWDAVVAVKHFQESNE